MRGVFVTGTDTGVGKTVLAAAICAALAATGSRVAAFKPVVTGLDEAPGPWPRDHELLAASASAGQRADQVAPWMFGPPVSPHFAAEMAGVELDPRELLAAARAAAAEADTIVCEGVGGLLVPVSGDYLVRDFAVDLGLPVVVAARPGLGTISHSLLTVEAARAAGLQVSAVVLTPWPTSPAPIEQSNRETIERLGRVAVYGLAPTRPRDLAAAATELPVTEWLGTAAA